MKQFVRGFRIMEYWFLILVCYAVKCENVGNNYFVVKKPENNIQQQDVKDFKKPFQVYWNVPTMQCTSKRIPFQNLYEKFGIIQNDNDRFIGNKIVIIYNEIDFPAIINNKNGKNVLRNGGVPQEGNLENHLIAFENNLNDKIPDPYFDGIAIIDFESWRPVFRQNFGSLVPHKTLSIEIEKRLHNWWPKMWIEREALLRFEAAARRFMSTTLSMAKELRPNALWGYYGFPYCFNTRGKDMAEKCASNIDKENDSIYWLWAESTALFPSIYSSVSLTSSQLSSLIKGRVKEASRVRGVDTPIFPYVWYRYRDAGFITEKDLDVAFATLYQSNASGLIIWGSSNDVNTVEKCNKLLKYVETVLGPKIAKYTKPIKKIHNDHLENKEIYTKQTSTVIDELTYSQSTQSLNSDKLFSTETLNDYSKFTKTDEGSQSLNNDKMSSTESTVKYNDYTNTDESKILHNFDLTSSLLESSTIHSEYMNAYQRKQTPNNDEISYMNSDKNLQSLNNDDKFSSQISKAYSKYINTIQTTQTLNNNKLSLVENLNTYNAGESSQTSNIDIYDTKTPHVYNDYSDAEKHVEPLISADLISLSESSTIDNIYKDILPQTSNMSNEKTTLVYNDYSETEENVQTLNNYDVMSSSESSTTPVENRDYDKNDEISLSKITTVDNSYSDKSSQFSNMSIEETTIVNEEYSENEKIVKTLHNDSSTIYEKNSDFVTTTLNNKISLSRVLTIDSSYRDESLQTSYYQMSSEETTIAYNEYSENEENRQTLNNDDVVSSSDSSTIYEKNSDFVTTTLNNEISLSKVLTIDSSYRDENSQTLNNQLSNEETTIAYNEYSKTGDNLHTLNNDNALSSTVSSTTFDENRDTVIFNNDEISLTDIDNKYSYINTDKEIPSKRTSIIYDDIEYLKETSPPSVEISSTDKGTAILVNGEIITEENKFESNGDEFFNNNMLPNSSEDRFDYLIKADNSANIENLKQFEYENSTNVEDDYLIIVRDQNKIQNSRENTTKSKLETVYYTTQADNENHETMTSSEHFSENQNDLDLIVTYIDKKIGIKRNEELPTKDESFLTIKPSNSGDDDGDGDDYLIKVDNSTYIDTYNRSENTNITNDDNGYLIIVPDFNNERREIDNIFDNNLDLVSTTQTKSDFEADTKFEDLGVAGENLEPVVAYINKIMDNHERISTGDKPVNNTEFLSSDEDASDYLIKLVKVKESDSQYEYTESTIADNDYIIVVKNLDDSE